MSNTERITVKRNHRLTFPKIAVPLQSPSKDELNDTTSEEDYRVIRSGTAQTTIDGIQTPIIAIDGKYIASASIIKFELSVDECAPHLELTVNDKDHLFANTNTPAEIDKIQIKLIPSEDGKFANIDLIFKAYDVAVKPNGTTVMSGKYYVEGLYDEITEAFGKISTYNLADKLSNRLGLGFATNIITDTTERFQYTASNSIFDTLKKSAGDTVSYSFWIDFWNNVNIVDTSSIYYSDARPHQIWVSPLGNFADIAQKKMIEEDCIVTNKISAANSQLYIPAYSAGSSPIVNYSKVITTWNGNSKESAQIQLCGTAGNYNEIVTKDYLGESPDEFNELQNSQKNKYLRDKIYSQVLRFKLSGVCFGIFKGSRIQFDWYEQDTDLKSTATADTTVSSSYDDDSEIGEKEIPDNTEVKQVLNKLISGFYMVTNQKITFKNGYLQTDYEISQNTRETKQINID